MCYFSLQSFLKFSIMKKQKKIIHKIISSNYSKSSIKKSKKILRIFGFDLDRLAHGEIIFAPVRKYLRNGKKISTCLKKGLKLRTELRPYNFPSCLFDKGIIKPCTHLHPAPSTPTSSTRLHPAPSTSTQLISDST